MEGKGGGERRREEGEGGKRGKEEGRGRGREGDPPIAKQNCVIALASFPSQN